VLYCVAVGVFKLYYCIIILAYIILKKNIYIYILSLRLRYVLTYIHTLLPCLTRISFQNTLLFPCATIAQLQYPFDDSTAIVTFHYSSTIPEAQYDDSTVIL